MVQPPELLDGYPLPGHPSCPVTTAPVLTPVPRDPPPLVSQPPSGPSPEHNGDANAYAPDG